MPFIDALLRLPLGLTVVISPMGVSVGFLSVFGIHGVQTAVEECSQGEAGQSPERTAGGDEP